MPYTISTSCVQWNTTSRSSGARLAIDTQVWAGASQSWLLVFVRAANSKPGLRHLVHAPTPAPEHRQNTVLPVHACSQRQTSRQASKPWPPQPQLHPHKSNAAAVARALRPLRLPMQGCCTHVTNNHNQTDVRPVSARCASDDALPRDFLLCNLKIATADHACWRMASWMLRNPSTGEIARRRGCDTGVTQKSCLAASDLRKEFQEREKTGRTAGSSLEG